MPPLSARVEALLGSFWLVVAPEYGWTAQSSRPHWAMTGLYCTSTAGVRVVCSCGSLHACQVRPVVLYRVLNAWITSL